jgi:hypothetical protein
MEQANRVLATTFALVLTVTLAVACAGQKSPQVYVTAEAAPPTIVVEPQPTPTPAPKCVLLTIKYFDKKGHYKIASRIFTLAELAQFEADLDSGKPLDVPGGCKKVDSIDMTDVSCE